MNFDTWYDLYSYPYESREDAAERYIEEQGVDDPAEKQGFLDSLPEYREIDLQEQRQRYSHDLLGDDWPSTPIDLPDPDYVDDPDIFDQWGAGIDEMQASGASALAGPVSGFLSEYVSEDLGAGLKGWAEEQRDINLEEAAQVKRPETREEILKRDPTSWYQYTPEFFPTGHEIVRSTPTSLAAAGIALPAAVLAAKGAGVVGLAALGKAAVGAGTGMVAGNVASSLQVAGEAYERGKNDPVIREELGVDPNKDFKDLSPEDQQKIDRFATDLSQSSFGHRLYTSGLLEMASFIPYGPILGRWALDTGLGTTSELMDRELYAEDAADKLVEYGLPRERALELQEKMLNLGPSQQETFIKALVQEGIMGGGFSAFESITGASDPRVNQPATASNIQRKIIEGEQKEMSKRLKEDAKEDALAQGLGFDSADQMNQSKEAEKERLWQQDVRLREEHQRQREEQQAKNADELFWEERYNETVRMRKEAEENQRIENARIDARAEEIATEEDIYSGGRVAEMNRVVSPIIAKEGQDRTAEERVDLAAYKKLYGVTDEKKLLDIKGKKIVTQEKSQKRTKKERESAQEKAKDEAKRGMLFARNPLPDGTKTPGLWGKFKQVFGIAPAKDKGTFKLKKNQLASMFRGIEKKFKKFKGKFVVVDEGDLDMVVKELEGRQVPVEGKEGEMRFATKDENTLYARKALGLEGREDQAKAWTLNDKIFINADGLTGKNADEVVEAAIQVGMFHEPIAHIGLKESFVKKLGKKEGQKKFDELMDDFYRSNEKDINNWVTRYAEGYLEGQDIKNISIDKKRELAEEYLANVFVEFGVRDPNIIARIADSLKRGGHDTLFGTRKVTTVQMREMLADIQREYIGGERNIISGDFFDRSHWLKPRAGGKEEEEPQWKPPKVVASDLETKAPVFQKALPEKTKGKLTPTIAETEAKKKAEATPLGRLKQRLKDRKKKTEEPVKETTTEVRFAKRVSTPEKRKLWQSLNKPNTTPEITRRDKELTELAKKLEKGLITNEEYSKRYNEKFPIRTFDTVPKLAKRIDVASAITQGQYDEGKLIGEDSDLKDGMEILARTDVKTMEKYNMGVVAVVSPEAKGSHYGRAVHLDSYKDGKPVKTVVRNLKKVLGIAAGEPKFPMAYFKGIYRATPATKVRALAQGAKKKPDWIEVGMEPKRQSSFYARETKTINGKEIKEGTPIGTAEEVLQVGMFAIVKNPTTQAVPTFTSAEGKEVRFARQPSKKVKAEDFVIKGISVSPMDFLDPKGFVDPLELNKKMKRNTSTDPMSGVIRFSKKPERYKAKGGVASWITWADQGKWIDFGKLPDLNSVRDEALKDFMNVQSSAYSDIEYTGQEGTAKGIKRLTNVDNYVDRQLTRERMDVNPDLYELYRQYGSNVDKIKEDFLKKMQEIHDDVILYNVEYLQEYGDAPLDQVDRRFGDYIFQNAMLRALLYEQGDTKIAPPHRIEGAALAETYNKFKEGKFTGLKGMLKHYKEQAAKIAEERLSADAITTLDGGKWYTLPVIEKGMTTEQQIEVTTTWASLSDHNWCTSRGMEKTYAQRGPMYVYRNGGQSLIAIRFEGNDVAEIQSQANNGTIPAEYVDVVKEFVNSPNIKLTNTAKKTINKAEAEARALQVIEERKKKDAKWGRHYENNLERVPSYYNELSKIQLEDGSYAVRFQSSRHDIAPILNDMYGKADTYSEKQISTPLDSPTSFIASDLVLDFNTSRNDFQRVYEEITGYGKKRTFKERFEIVQKISKESFPWTEGVTDITGKVVLNNVSFPKLLTIYDTGVIELGLLDPDWTYGGNVMRDSHGLNVEPMTDLPVLSAIGGELTIGDNVSIPKLKIVNGNVLISGSNNRINMKDSQYIGIEDVGKHLVLENFTDMPYLKTINGDFLDSLSLGGAFKNQPAPKDYQEMRWANFPSLELIKGNFKLGQYDLSQYRSPNTWYYPNSDRILLPKLHDVEGSITTGAHNNPFFPELYSVGGSIESQRHTFGNWDDRKYTTRIRRGFTSDHTDYAHISEIEEPAGDWDNPVPAQEYRKEWVDRSLWVKPKDKVTWEVVGLVTEGDNTYGQGFIPYPVTSMIEKENTKVKRAGHGKSYLKEVPPDPLKDIYTEEQIENFREKEFLKAVDEIRNRPETKRLLEKAEGYTRYGNFSFKDHGIETKIEMSRVRLLKGVEERVKDYKKEGRTVDLSYRSELGNLHKLFDGVPWTTSLFPEEIKARQNKIKEINKGLGINAPNLTVVGGNIDVFTSSYLPNLKNIGGSLEIFLDDVSQFNPKFLSKLLPNLEKVGGEININVLEESGKRLYMKSDQRFGDAENISQSPEKFKFGSQFGLKVDESIDLSNPFPKLKFVGKLSYKNEPKISKKIKAVNKKLQKIGEYTKGRDMTRAEKIVENRKAEKLHKKHSELNQLSRLQGEALKGTVLDPRTQETTRFAKLVKQPAPKVKRAVKVSPDTKETREPTVGININDKTQDFTGQILSGRKTMETRDTDSLRAYVGKEVGIISTGKGKAQVVGYMTVGEPVVYNNREEFKKDQSKHLVKTGSDFDIKAGKTKYGYPLTNVRKVAPFPVTTKGMVSRKISAPEVKFAKRVDQPTAKELEAEWTKKSAKVKPDTKIPKDKVSLGNKKFTTGTYVKQDLSVKKILDPKGQVRTSRVMMGNAAAHAMGTRSWNPLTRWTEKTQPFADKLLERMIAQGTLPDSAEYKDLRRLLKGAIYKAEQGGKKLYDILAKSKQKEIIFEYFTVKGSNPNLITDRAERQAAIEAKEEIHQIGKELVDRKLLHEAAFKKLEGAYLPQVYLKYLLGDKNFNNVKAGGKLDLRYLEGRKDLSEGVKQLLLHQVKDPAYLGSKAVAIPRTDMAILDFLQQIALNPKWVLPQSMVTFDVYSELRNLAIKNNLSKGIIDSLKSDIGLLDTKKNKVSAHWLNTEATRIRKTAPDAGLSVEERKTLDELTEKMMKASEGKTNEGWETYDPKNYRQIPKSVKYGSLAGMWVRKEIASDLFGGMNVATGDISTAEAWLGDAGIIGDYNRLWKWAKVSANPPSWVRNFVSNMILMNMGGVPVGRMPDLILSSLADMKKAGKHGGKLHQLAKDLGLTAGTFSNVELGRIEREFKDLQRRLQSEKSGPWAVFGAVKGAFNKVRDVTGDIYGGIDSLGKMMMLKYFLDQRGIDIKDISKYQGKEQTALNEVAAQAEKWLFDYSNVLPSVKWLRRAPLGAPFISFTSFVAPLMLETAITKPWKFAPYYAFGWAMKEWFKNNHDLDEDDLEGLKLGLSEYLREKAKESIFPTGVIPLPFLDENKRVQWLDISYLYPWGMFSEMAGELADGQIGQALKTAGLMGSPLFNIASAVSTGIDPFSRREIVDPMGTPTEQAMDIWWYAFNLTMPPFMHGAGWGNDGFGAGLRMYDAFMGNLAKDGEAKFTMFQASLRMAGINITPLAVPEGATKQLKFEQSLIRKLIYNAEREIKNMYVMQKSASEIQSTIKEFREKIIARVMDWREKVRKATPPVSIARPRMEHLRKKEAELRALRVG